MGFNERWFPSSRFQHDDTYSPSSARGSQNHTANLGAPISCPVVACIKNALDGCVASRQVLGPDQHVWVHWVFDSTVPGLARDPTDLLVRTSMRCGVFKMENPPSRLSRATPKRCRTTLSPKTSLRNSLKRFTKIMPSNAKWLAKKQN